MTRRQRRCAAAVVVAVLCATGTAHAQTLEEALSLAYANNPTLKAQRARLRAVDEGVPQALSNWRPTVEVNADGGASANRNNTATVETNRRQHRNPWSVSVTATQPLFRGLRTTAATRGAEESVQAERARLAAVEQDVLLAATTAYMDVLRDQAVLRLNINNEQVLRRQLEATQDRFTVGEVTRTDVHQAEARLAGATADRIQAEGDLEESRAAYVNLIGQAPGQLTPPGPVTDLPEDKTAALAVAAADNPNVVGAQFDERAARHAVDEVRGELLPTLNLEGTASRAFEASSEESRSDTYSGLLTLNVPLYQSGAVYSRLREAKQTVAQERQDIDQALRDATEDATSAWETLVTTRARIQSFETQIRANEVALEGVEREAAVGSRTVLDVLDAEQELLDAKVDLVRAQRDEVVAIFQLKAAIGRLTARDMDLPVELYDPDQHYREVRDRWFGASSSGQVEE